MLNEEEGARPGGDSLWAVGVRQGERAGGPAPSRSVLVPSPSQPSAMPQALPEPALPHPHTSPPSVPPPEGPEGLATFGTRHPQLFLVRLVGPPRSLWSSDCLRNAGASQPDPASIHRHRPLHQPSSNHVPGPRLHYTHINPTNHSRREAQGTPPSSSRANGDSRRDVIGSKATPGQGQR